MGLNKNIVELELDYENWKKSYIEVEKELKEILSEIIIDIQHVGSTSVPNLKAKPIVDVAIAVENLNSILKYEKELTEKGYSLRNDGGIKGEYLIRKGPEENRTHYIHVVELNSKRWLEFITFKNILLNNPDIRDEYQSVKEELKEKFSKDRKSYTKAKNEYISKIFCKFDKNM